MRCKILQKWFHSFRHVFLELFWADCGNLPPMLSWHAHCSPLIIISIIIFRAKVYKMIVFATSIAFVAIRRNPRWMMMLIIRAAHPRIGLSSAPARSLTMTPTIRLFKSIRILQVILSHLFWNFEFLFNLKYFNLLDR